MWCGCPAIQSICCKLATLLSRPAAGVLIWTLLSHVATFQMTFAQQPPRPLFGMSIRNSVLEERFKQTRNEEQPVSKLLLNTNVTGTQSTVTETRLRIVPDEKSLKFELLNSGKVNSQTTGYNPQATVDSVGNHHFDVTKPLWFDGSVFLTQPAYGTIQASQTPRRVQSTAGVAMPLLGRLTDRVAWEQVWRKTPQINRVVAEDVSRDVLPKIDRIVDSDFAKLQRDWKVAQQNVASAFRRKNLHWAARSGTESMAVWVHDGQVAATNAVAPVPQEARTLRPDEAVAVFVSEDAVNLLVDQYFPAGLKLSDTQMQKLQLPETGSSSSGSFSLLQLVDLLSAAANAEPAEAGIFTIEFAQKDPIRIGFVNGDIRLLGTFQIHPKLGASSGWMTTTFNMRGKRLSAEHWTIAVRNVDVGESDSSAEEVAVTDPMELLTIPVMSDEQGTLFPEEPVTTVQAGTVWMPIVRNAAQSLAEKIPPVKLPLEFDGSDFVPESPVFRLGKIDSARGILRIGLKVVESKPTATSSSAR